MIRVLDVELRLMNLRTRLPFRYGIATLRACPHLFLKLTAEVDGRRVSGVAADHLSLKWFTKDPGTTYEQDIADMLAVIRHAGECAMGAGECTDVYSLASAVYSGQAAWGRVRNFPPLLYNFGVSLVERAAIEAFCKARGVTFARAVRENLLGIRFDSGMLEYGELAGTSPADWLPAEPIRRIVARHTVGLVDALSEDDIGAGERVADGLPQSLAAAIGHYGLRHFKLKIAGDVGRDLERLRRIFAVIGEHARGEWAFTIDGNENYGEVAPFRRLWEALASDDTLRGPMRRLMFVEQPLHRDVALSEGVAGELLDWRGEGGMPPTIIDESDGYPGALLRALACGYVGTSHKNCKGIAKGIANACLLARRRREDPGGAYLMSGEDLSNVGPVALMQDLAACAVLGIESVERNGQHYFRGLSMHSREVQAAVLAAHGDLYEAHPAGFATVRVRDGWVEVGSTVGAAFGVGFELDLSQFSPLADWVFQAG